MAVVASLAFLVLVASGRGEARDAAVERERKLVAS